MNTREDILRKIKALKEAIDDEAVQRMDIERTKEYRAAQADIDNAEAIVRDTLAEIAATRERQREMIAVVSDSRIAMTEAKQELMALMELEGVEGFNEDWISAKGKYSEKKSVNGKRLLEVLGGDIEEFCKLAKPTQKAVTDYAKENDALKKQLLGCIKLESRELVDVEISIPEAA